MSNTIDVKEIKLPFKHGEAPAINWGADFNELSDQLKIVYLKKFSSSMNHATMLIQNERNVLAGDISVMTEMLASAEQATMNQRNTLTSLINTHNADKQSTAQEIAVLKRQITKLSEC